MSRLTCSGGLELLRLVKLSLCLACTVGFAGSAASAGAVNRPTVRGAHHRAVKATSKSRVTSHSVTRRSAKRAANNGSGSKMHGRHTSSVGHSGGTSHSSPSVYAPALVPQRQLSVQADPSSAHPTGRRDDDADAAVPNAAVPPEPVVPLPVDDGAVHTVAQQLARGAGALQFPGALRHFFGALRQLPAESARTVRVMQFGDSHTAADMFTGEARARMQARFGDGGIGFSYAGHPFAGYRILGSGRGQSGGWTTLGTHFTQLGDAELGLGGVAIQSSRAGESASLDARCLTLQVQYLRQPGGGSVQLTDNGAAVETASTSSSQSTGVNEVSEADGQSAGAGQSIAAEIPHGTFNDRVESPSRSEHSSGLAGAATPTPAFRDAGTAGVLQYRCAGTLSSHHFTLTAQGDGPVRLLGTVTMLPGVTWEALGINGAEAPLMLRWNQPLFRSLLAAATPDLIVLAYGTNEAAAHWGGEEYRASFGRLIDVLHRTSPSASVLVVGPADRSLGSTSYTVVGRGRRARRIAHRYFSPYGGTERIVAAQREVCSTHDCAFWNWQARQGGLGAMNRWVSAGYAQPDHTHFTAVGYHALADALVADLLSAYSGYVPHTSVGAE